MKTSIASLESYKPNEEKYDIILDANESPSNFNNQLLEKFVKEIQEIQFNRYPENSSKELRNAYANYANVKAENIICGNGSDEIIRLIFESYVDKNDNIVVHNPTFSMYNITNIIHGGKTINVECNEDDFSVDIKKVVEASNKNDAKVVFLCNPNNPTGYLFSKCDIEYAIKNTKALVVVDEAYIEFDMDSTSIDLINKYPNVIILRTMSKAFGLAGIRCGFGISNTDIIDLLNKVKPPYNLNCITQTVAKIALENSDLMKKQVKSIIFERNYLICELQKLKIGKVYKSNSNFIFIKTNSEKIKKILGNNIAIRYFGDKYVRISVGTASQNKQLLEILGKVSL